MTQRLLDILVSSFPRLVLYCVQVTIPLTVCIYILSLVLGFLLALIQIQKIPVLKPLARVYVWVFRGTPLIVQMYIIFFGLPSLGITLDAFPSAVIAFSLNYAAYMSEAIRAAIQSVPEGQWEAGYMIGLSSGQIMLRVILPQAARVAFPTLFSTLIGLTKDSSLAASITVVEMFKAAQQIASRTFEPFALYCEAAFVYLMLNTVLTLLQSVLEKRLAWKQPKQQSAVHDIEIGARAFGSLDVAAYFGGVQSAFQFFDQSDLHIAGGVCIKTAIVGEPRRLFALRRLKIADSLNGFRGVYHHIIRFHHQRGHLSLGVHGR